MIKRLLIVAILLIMMGCSQPPRVQYFTLSWPDPAPARLQAKTPVLFVQDVIAEGAARQDHLVFSDSPYKMGFDPYRAWIDPPAQLVKIKAVDFIRLKKVYHHVTETRPRPQQNAFRRLSITIKQFQEILTETGRAVSVVLYVDLSDARENPLWAGTVSRQIDLQSGELAVVEGMSNALNQCLDDLVQQIIQY